MQTLSSKDPFMSMMTAKLVKCKQLQVVVRLSDFNWSK